MQHTPTLIHGDSLSIGQLADRWDVSPDVVHGLIENEDLAVDDRGFITNSELHRFYQSGGQSLLSA
jgi:hypothetical protein